MSMKNFYIPTGNALGLPKPELTEVYQEAALSLRYKRITSITADKLERAVALLQLKPHHLLQRGLVPRSSLAQGLDYAKKQEKRFQSVASGSSDAERSYCFQKDLNGIDGEHDEDDQDDGWGDYEDNYDSDSDIDDDEDQDDEIEGRRKGPIYAFLVYGGVQLRPDEYVLLFRALGVSPQYIQQLNHPDNSETAQKPYKILSSSLQLQKVSPRSGGAVYLAGGFHWSKPMLPRPPSSNGRKELSTGSSRGVGSHRSLFERAVRLKRSSHHLTHFVWHKKIKRGSGHEIIHINALD